MLWSSPTGQVGTDPDASIKRARSRVQGSSPQVLDIVGPQGAVYAVEFSHRSGGHSFRPLNAGVDSGGIGWVSMSQTL